MKNIKVNNSIILKQIEISDAKDIFTTIDNEREYLGKWLPFVENTKNITDTENFINSIYAVPKALQELIFVILYKNKFVGLIGFKDTDRDNNKTEVGYWLSQHFQKKGIITESFKVLINFAFEELNINRIQVKCATGNTPSKNIPKKLGLYFEGIERDGELLSGCTS